MDGRARARSSPPRPGPRCAGAGCARSSRSATASPCCGSRACRTARWSSPTRRACRWAATRPPSPRPAAAAIEALPRSTSRGGAAKVVVALPRAQILRKQFTLPAAVEENLEEAIGYDLDRHTPFPADQLYFDAVVIGRDPAKKEIRVDWAAALRTTVDAARRHAESWGAMVVGVTPESAEPGSDAAAPPAVLTRLNLLPEDERPDTRLLAPAGILAAGGAARAAGAGRDRRCRSGRSATT